MKKTLARLAVVAVLAAGITGTAAVVTPEPASAHWISGCLTTHTPWPYRNEVVRRTLYSGVGTYGPWVETDWKATNRVTGSVHYDHTERRCFRPGLGF